MPFRLLLMTWNGCFVSAKAFHAFHYAICQAYAQMVRSRTQGAFGNRQLRSHLSVMFDLSPALVQVVVENQFP
ncbi:MAG TPA: hypothetical protein VF353_03675, partial [Candidatus Binatia bacterium]